MPGKVFQSQKIERCVKEGLHPDCTFIRNSSTHLTQVGFFCGHEEVRQVFIHFCKF